MPSDCPIEHVLHGHQRAITDINFHSVEPDIIATCSIDSKVNVWDLRDPSRPTTTFADWNVGASQVKWNRLNPFILASSHDRNVYIWDTRKGSIPLHTIKAHDSKVNSIDFNRIYESKLLTCSNDHTVKGWDYNVSDEEPKFTIKTDFPIWRARHTPFGRGCVIMPLRGGNHSVFLTNLLDVKGEHQLSPKYVFRGHTEPVKEFVWRSRGGDANVEDREFQLVTWSKDHDLRLWPVDDKTLESVHFQRHQELTMKITRKGARYETYRNEPTTRKNARVYNKGLNTVGGYGGYGLSPSSGGRRTGIEYMISKSGSKDDIHSHPHRSHQHHHHHHNRNHHHHHHQHHHYNRNRSRNNRRGYMTRASHNAYNLNNNSHLDWISGVRMGRAAFDPPFDSTIKANFFPGMDSSSPGNLGEEVSIVGHKFPKVRFEKISVSTGECIITLKAPWGENDNDLVFIRVHVQFPIDYPFSPPAFKVEEDNAFGEGKIEFIKDELTKISHLLSSHGRYCLEICLRFLLGEKVSYEELERQEMEKVLENENELAITGGGRFSFGVDEEDELLELTNDFIYSSSDDDMDEVIIASREDRTNKSKKNSMNKNNHDLFDEEDEHHQTSLLDGLAVTQQISESSKVLFDSTPVPKGCGAVWSKNGELVCFFISKSEKSNVSRLPKFGDKGLSQMLNFRDDSGDSDSSDSFESDTDLLDGDVDTGGGGAVAGAGNHQPYYGILGTGRLRNSLRFKQFSNHSGPVSNSGGSQAGFEKIQNVIRIYDFKYLIPSRRDIAAEYKVLGGTPEVLARLNRQVAEKYGCHEIAYCWLLIEMILGVKIDIHSLGLAKANSKMNFQPFENTNNENFFDWSKHPFGKQWLVDELFNYFELQNNTQMLAHMSCILSGSCNTICGPTNLLPESGIVTNSIKSPYSQDNAGGYFSPLFFSSNHPTRAHTDLSLPGGVGAGVDTTSSPLSTASSLISSSPEKHIGGFRSIPSTPHYRSHIQSRDISATSSKLMMIAKNQNQNQHQYHNSSNHGTANNSVKSNLGKLSRLDSENDLNLGFIFNKSGQNTQLGSRNSLVSDLGKSDNNTPSYLPTVRIEILCDEFLDFAEKTHSTTTHQQQHPAPPQLLDSNKIQRYIAYRDQYATMLYSWGLQVERLEILKFNYAIPGAYQPVRRPSVFDKFHCAYIQFRTMRHLEDFEIVNTADMTLNRSYSRTCHYCKLMIKTRFFQCNNCEHIQHSECGIEWFVRGGERECPSGCGCLCLDYL